MQTVVNENNSDSSLSCMSTILTIVIIGCALAILFI